MEQNNTTCENCNAKFNEFQELVNNLVKSNGTMLMALQEAQQVFGYLDKDAMNMIAKSFNTTTSQIYAIASFYSQFKFVKQGKYRISLCLGTACYVRGAANVQKKLEEVLKVKMNETTPDGKFTLGNARCVGCCGLAPVMLINEKVYPSVKPDSIPNIIGEYKE
jgi:NADH:ubiquinone oxidoreductase subunit E